MNDRRDARTAEGGQDRPIVHGRLGVAGRWLRSYFNGRQPGSKRNFPALLIGIIKFRLLKFLIFINDLVLPLLAFTALVQELKPSVQKQACSVATVGPVFTVLNSRSRKMSAAKSAGKKAAINVTTGLSASLAVHGEVKRGCIHREPQAPSPGGGEASAFRPKFFTSRVSVRGLVRKAVLGVLACGVAFAAAAEPVKIRFGFADIGVGNRQFSSAGIAAIAATRGFIEDEFKDDKDVSVEFLYFKGAGPATNEALANGQIDFASHGDLPATVGRANGLKTKILAPSGARTNIYLAARPDSGITKVEDLKGKKLALFRGTNLHLATVTVLAAHGLKERDVRIVNMDFATARAALASGDVDAGIGQVDYFDLEPKGIANIVWDTRGKDPKFLRHAHVHVTEAFEQVNPEITYRVAKALVRAAAWASDENNRDAVFETWAQTGYPKENFAREYEGQALSFRNSPLTDEYLVAAYKRQAELAREGGLLRKEVSIEDWFEPKYVERAVKELGYENLWTRYDADGKPIAP